MKEAQITESSLSACERNEEIKCRVDHGWGLAICGGASFDPCEPKYCDPGYDLVNGQCIAQLCTPTNEVACSTQQGFNILGVGVGSCTQTGGSATSCDPWVCLNGYNKDGTQCQSVCQPGEIRQCAERNGFGSQSCESSGRTFGACVLNSCESGFVFDPDTRICKGELCNVASTLACQSEWGAGTRVCNSVQKYSALCDPIACPPNFTKKDFSCWPNICTANQIRNSLGVCVDKVVCASGSGKVVVNNICVCPGVTYDIGGICGTCTSPQVYDPVAKSCTLVCQAPLVKGVSSCECPVANQVYIGGQCVSKDIDCTLSASPIAVTYNGTTTLQWTTLNADKTTLQCTGQPTSHMVANLGTEVLADVKAAATCDLITTNLAGISKKCSASISSIAPPAATCAVTFSKNPALYNDNVVATLSGTNVDPSRSHILSCGASSLSALSLPINLSLNQVKANSVCTGKVYNLANVEQSCSASLTVTQPGAPACTLSYNPNPIYASQSTNLQATFLNVSSANLSCPQMTSLNGVVNVADGTIRSLNNLTAMVNCTLTVVNVAGTQATCTATITPQPAPAATCTSIQFSPTPIGVGDTVSVTANGLNIDTTKANKITCGGVDIPLVGATSTKLMADLSSVTSGKTCTATVYNVLGNAANCSAASFTVVPNPTCTSLTFSPATITTGASSTITAVGSNIDITKLNQILCNNTAINLTTKSSTQLVGNMTNVTASQTCTANVYNSANKMASCPVSNLTVAAAASCTQASFAKSPIAVGENVALNVSGANIDTARTPTVTCTGGSFVVGSVLSTAVSGTYSSTVAGTFSCTIKPYSLTGTQVTCPAASVVVAPAVTCTAVTATPNPANIGANILVSASGSGIDISKANLITCGPQSFAPTTKTSTTISGTWSGVASSANCTATVYNSAGLSATCPAKAVTVCGSGTMVSGASCICSNGATDSPTCVTCATGKYMSTVTNKCELVPTPTCVASVVSASGTAISGALSGSSVLFKWTVTNGTASSYSCSGIGGGAVSANTGSVAQTMGASNLSCTLSYSDFGGASKSCSSNTVSVWDCTPGSKDSSACTAPANGTSVRTCSSIGKWGACVATCSNTSYPILNASTNSCVTGCKRVQFPNATGYNAQGFPDFLNNLGQQTWGSGFKTSDGATCYDPWTMILHAGGTAGFGDLGSQSSMFDYDPTRTDGRNWSVISGIAWHRPTTWCDNCTPAAGGGSPDNWRTYTYDCRGLDAASIRQWVAATYYVYSSNGNPNSSFAKNFCSLH